MSTTSGRDVVVGTADIIAFIDPLAASHEREIGRAEVAIVVVTMT
jgi:hypothetical protein